MKRGFLFIIVLFAVAVAFLIYQAEAGMVYNSEEGKFTLPLGRSYSYSDIYVTRVIDGDTLKLENGERVRLIGIDTPEMHDSDKLYRDSKEAGQDIQTIKALGKRAYNFTRNLVEGRRVRLEFDLERQDKYGRLLAYVYLNDNGTFVNAEIIRQGYASLMTFPPNVKYADLFLKLYQEAREQKRGLWK
jgi:micrococcal nuclease